MKRVFKRLMLFAFTLIVAFGALANPSFNARAASTSKRKKSYDIAVVFDNSGSMYNNEAWCRAKYAMEIFASMLDYESGENRLNIFPMWEVTTDGSTPDSGGSYAAFSVTSKEDINKISNLFTVRPSNTPFEPISEAYNHLNSSNASEKWLIVLTDGEFNLTTRDGQLTKIDIQNELSSLASKASGKIKIQYLGFGAAASLTPNESIGFYAKTSDDKSLKDDLIGICNTIFQRSVLPGNRLKTGSLELDLSMKNLIVFAQGANAKVVSLTDESGKKIDVTMDSGQRKYSEIRANKYPNAPADKNLAGQVVTFAACPKGKYKLEYSDADKIQVFYEPDVDIRVSLINSDGEQVDTSSGEIVPGDYTVESAIVDSATGEDVTKHELMGSNVELNTYVKASSDSDFKEYPNGSKITLGKDDSTEIYVEGKYLKDYTISTKDDPSAFPFPIKVLPAQNEFSVEAKVLQPQSWYVVRDHENWKPIKVNMALNGAPLTAEQMARVTPDVVLDGSKAPAYRVEIKPDESSFYIYIGSDESGSFVEPETGSYKLKASAAYIDEYGNNVSDSSDVRFDIQIYSKVWKWLFWIFLIVLLIALIAMILNKATLPNSIYMEIPKAKTSPLVKRNGNMLSLSTDTYPGELRCEAKACTPLKNSRKKNAKFRVKDIKPLGSVEWYEINGMRYKKSGGSKFVDGDGKTILDKKSPITISNGSEIKWKTVSGVRTGIVHINSKH